MLSVAFLVTVFVVAFLAVTVGPLYAADRFRETRPPTSEERERIDAIREAAGLDVEPVAVVSPADGTEEGETDAGGTADGGGTADSTGPVDLSVRGPPGRRVLFVTPAVLDLEEPVATALFAAEAGRVETYYNEFRALAIGVVLALLAAIVTTLVPFTQGFTALALIGFVSFWVGRRVQYGADARAAERVGGDQLADAFERIAEIRGVEPETGTWRTWFEVQPPLGDRIDRLRERD